MNNPSSDILRRLNQQQFKKALEILSEEQEVNKLSRKQRILYRFLMPAVYISIALIFDLIYEGFNESVFSENSFYGPTAFFIFWILACYILIIVLLNLPLLLKARNQAKLIRKLNLKELYAISWRERKKKRRFARLLSTIFPLLGGFFIVLAFILQGGDHEVWPSFLVFGLLIIIAYFIQMNKHRMDDMMNVDKLKEAFLHYRDTAEENKKAFIEIPFDKMTQIAHIEVGQIVRQRAAAIDSMNRADGPGYTTRRSKSFQASAMQMGAEGRLALEKRIEVLLNNARPKDAVLSHDQKTLELNIPAISYTLTYAIDDSQSNIELLALQSSKNEMDDLNK